jgi:protein-tyrosine phosphatase
MIDIHSHILSSVDDGSKDMQMSLEMARIYLENKVDKVIATPHFIDGAENSSLERNKIILAELRNKLEEEKMDLEVFLGNEVMISPDIIMNLEKEYMATLNNSRYILMEFPMYDIPLYTHNIIYELQIKGYRPIIAHPERYTSIAENPNLLFELVEKGALAQLNLPSLEGRYGKKIAKTARILIKHNLIHFVSSDAHRNNTRSPHTENSLNLLKKIVSEEDFHLMTQVNGLALLQDKEISTKPPIQYKKPWYFI